MTTELLVDVAWLERNLDNESVRIVDARPPFKYSDGHIRNAINISHEFITTLRQESATQLDGGVRVVASKAEIERLLSQSEVDMHVEVVVYGEREWGNIEATYLFWTLEYFGHPRVALLDGGIEAWTDAKKPLTCQAPAHPPRTCEATEVSSKRVTGDWVLQHIEDPRVQILDNRYPEEYNGKDILVARGGHIPRAKLVNWADVLRPDATFRPRYELEELFSRAGIDKNKTIVTYCQNGVRAASVYFALRLVGYPDIRVYDASWSEWGNDERFPIESPEIAQSSERQEREAAATHRLDIRGQLCPYTLISTKRKMAQLGSGERLEVLTDNLEAKGTIPTWAGNAGHKVRGLEQTGDCWRILLERA